MPLDHMTDPALEAAWQATLARLPDRHELSDYQIARARDLFVSGWLARAGMQEGRQHKEYGNG
jgi:hypothetical protein